VGFPVLICVSFLFFFVSLLHFLMLWRVGRACLFVVGGCCLWYGLGLSVVWGTCGGVCWFSLVSVVRRLVGRVLGFCGVCLCFDFFSWVGGGGGCRVDAS
jgi:hypothetical protein